MLKMFKKSFWVPYENSSVYPTVSTAHQEISKYCEENGWDCSFQGDEEVIIDGKAHEIYRGYAARGNYGIKCREK